MIGAIWDLQSISVVDISLTIFIMVPKSLALLILAVCALAAINKDLVQKVPGYPTPYTQKVYSGYLNTMSDSRKLHYVFIESSSMASPDKIPVTLWLNGGPGCSSMLGFLQQIGPYYLEEGIDYKVGDNLTENPYSWNKLSHLLFIESPAGVGYSINLDANFTYNDETTANDNLYGLLSFFAGFPEYSNNAFWIAGQSYAGKYIPDLALKIDQNNRLGKPINLKGIMVGNGVMNFQNGQLERSSIDFMIDHEFVDMDIVPYYRGSCLIDPDSAGCRYFNTRFNANIDEINPYNIYSYCYYNDSFMHTSSAQRKPYTDQASILKNLAKNKGVYNQEQTKNGPTCAYFDGLFDYFKAHAKEFHADGVNWNGPCADNITAKYTISLAGSMKEYRTLLTKLDSYHIVLYSGDWDDVVPYTDTLKNMALLSLKQSNIYTPFFANDQHAGWTQVYDGVLFAIVKGASHQVPQSKRPQAFELFKMTLESTSFESKPTTE